MALPTFHLGIDPGVSGGICLLKSQWSHLKGRVYRETEVLRLSAMPTSASSIWFLLSSYRRAFAGLGNYRACLELVGGYVGSDHARGSHMFVFGENYGSLEMALTALDLTPIRNPSPQKWQGVVGIPKIKGEEQDDHKRRLKVFAQKLYPDVKGVTLNTCDALLIAHYSMIQGE